MQFNQVLHLSKEYDDCVRLRDEVLRKPLGLSFSKEELLAEDQQVHLACYNSDELVACLALIIVDQSTLKMRQVAVKPHLQGMGYGKQLVHFSESFAKKNAFSRMMLHARKSAVPFYNRMGYNVDGNVFNEVGLPHFKMYKKL